MESAAQSLVSNVGTLVGQEFNQLRGVGVEVARLRNELATINALLRMQSEADEASVDHFVRVWMKQLREVAYDAEDCVDLYQFRIRCRSGDHLFAWTNCKRVLTTLLARRQLAGDIRALRALASSINEQHGSYGFSLDSLSLRRQQVPAYQFVDKYGQAAELASKVSGVGGDKKRKVFSIVGFGGLGKTMLAREVCRQLETVFRCQAQVAVSQTFSDKDLQGLLKCVLRQIPLPTDQTTVDNAEPKTTRMELEQEVKSYNKKQANKRLYEVKIDTMDVNALASELHHRLRDRRYQ
uniref:Rx N-terminal domain-containing protein n=1 Tax=Oryza punctata TaxID=4537 RepID=A0A0E0MK34_ORYPU